MKKLLLALLVLLVALACVGMASAEGAPTPTPAPVSDMIAQPEATRQPIATATPRPADAPLPEDPFLYHAVEIARRVDMLAKSGPFYAYCNTMQVSRTVWDAVSRGDHTTPSHIYSLSGETLLLGLTGGDPDAAPWFDLSRVELRRDMVSTLPDMMLIGMDNEVVNCVHLLARFKVYASDMPDACGLLVMLYEDATPMVLYWYSDSGAVQVSAFFMPDEMLEVCTCAEDVSAWFASLNMPLVAFEEVHW